MLSQHGTGLKRNFSARGLLDGVDRCLSLAAQVVRDGRGARVLGRSVLGFWADHVVEVRLDVGADGRVRVLGAADEVRDEDDRVDAFGRAVELEREVGRGAAFLEGGVVDDGGCRLGESSTNSEPVWMAAVLRSPAADASR